MFGEYILSFLGLWVLIAMIIVQQFVYMKSKFKSDNAVSGIDDESLGHESFLFRSNRTFRNSLENILQFVLPVFIAMALGVFNITLAIVVWLYVFARIGHMVCYYKITTNKNPSPKSYFFLFGLFINVILMLIILVQIFTM
jgi:glutathione S-transferase